MNLFLGQRSLDLNSLLNTVGEHGLGLHAKTNYMMAEVLFMKAQMIIPDASQACNLVACLIEKGHCEEAHSILEDVLQNEILGSKEINQEKELKSWIKN